MVTVDVANDAFIFLTDICPIEVEAPCSETNGGVDIGIGDCSSFRGVLFALLIVAPVLLQLLSLLYNAVWNFGL